MTRVQYGINSIISLCVAGWLDTGSDGDEYRVTLKIYKVINIVFQIDLLRFIIIASLRVLLKEFNMVSMVTSVYVLVVGHSQVFIDFLME